MPSKLPNALISTLSPHLTLGMSRLETLSLLIILLVNVRTVNLTHIASQFSASLLIAVAGAKKPQPRGEGGHE